MSNLIIVEDQTIFLDALKLLIENMSVHKVVGVFDHPSNAMDYVETNGDNIDLALLDVRLPDVTGIELTKKMKEINPEMKVILLSQYPSREYVKAGVDKGSNGYILKNVEAEELIMGIEWVLEGREYYCQQAIKALTSYSKDEKLNMALSKREKEVLILIAEGKTTKEISKDLKIEESTVVYHRENVKSKLNLKKITDLTRYAYESGLLSLGNL